MQFLKTALMAGVMALGATMAQAQGFPTKPITMIVPFAAGGPTDIVARIVAENMSRTLGQTIVVENVAGAGGTTGITRAAKSTPDGYTIAMGHMGTHGASPGLYPTLAYNPQTDFEPIGLAAGTPIVIVARKNFPANNLKEFIAEVQKNQKSLNAAHAGTGSVSHITCLMLHDMLKVDVNAIPYRGTGPLLNDLVSDKVDYTCDQIVNVSEQIKGGNVKAFGIATPARSPALPDLPTTIEAGLPAYQVTAWNALFAPKGTEAGALAKLRDAYGKAVADPATRKRLEDLGGVVPTGADATHQGLAALVKSENERWIPLLKDKIKP